MGNVGILPLVPMANQSGGSYIVSLPILLFVSTGSDTHRRANTGTTGLGLNSARGCDCLMTSGLKGNVALE